MAREKLIQEIAEYLVKEPNMGRDDRRETLTRLVDREFFERGQEHVINRFDLLQIVSNAGSVIVKKRLPIDVSGKEMTMDEVRHIAMVESILGYLNRHQLLRREVNMDYTSSEYKFEPLD